MKKKYLGIIIPIITIVVAVVGLTYGYFSINIDGNEQASLIQVETGELSLIYTDSLGISLEAAYPGVYVEKTVSVENNGTLEAMYTMRFINYVNTFLNNELKISATCTRYEEGVETGECDGIDQKTLTEVVKRGVSIQPGVTNEYTIRIEFIELGINQNYNQGVTFSGTINIEEERFTPIEDFEYAIDTWVYPSDGTEVPVDEGYVLLTEYKGEDTTVNIPSTYQINGETYNTLIFYEEYNWGINTFMPYDETEDSAIPNTTIEYINLSKDLSIGYTDDLETWTYNAIYYMFVRMTALKGVSAIPSSVTNMEGTFWDCTSLTEAPVIPNSVTDMRYTFSGCTSLTEAPVIPSSVTNMYGTFFGCTSLTEAPVIPSSVTDMNSTFSGCTSLTEAPVIPNSVTNMRYTFQNCRSLTEAPVIPNSVTYMGGTFSGCTSLVEAPVIPNSVTYMYGTFYGCTNLEGEVLINSTGVTNINNIFTGTTKSITAKVPAGSTTFNTISGVTLPSNVIVETF